MQPIKQLLQVSARIYETLGDMPINEERDAYIEHIHQLLDERKASIETVVQEGFRFDEQNRTHCILKELDKGIQERLTKVMELIKQDLANLQKSKKNEAQYYNPYANVRVMDGMYYDKKN